MTYGLTRLLRTEDDWSDLLCFVAELDPEPLRTALLLAPGTITIKREVRVKARRGAPAGRADLIVLLDGIERAVMEMKLGAGAHGDQFAGYDAWAELKGIPVSARYLVGPNADPIPNEPSHWSRRLTLPSLLAGWSHSADDLARLLSIRALQQFNQLEAEATGPANQASIALTDQLRLRRLASITQATAPDDTFFEPQQRSRAGAANICAWRKTTDDGYVVAELQRLNPRGPKGGTDTPFEIRIMVGVMGATAEADGELADQHRDWLARCSVVQHAGSAVQAMVVEPENSGFKPEDWKGPGHPRYYGYEGGGQGSRLLLQSTVDLNDMVTVFSAALNYLETYPGR